MITVIEALGTYIYEGIAGSAAYDVARIFWQRAFSKGLEDLYIKAFSEAVNDQQPQLLKYGAPVGFDKESLSQVLHQEMALDFDRFTLTRIDRAQFVSQLAALCEEKQVVSLGGHNLSTQDYEELARNLIRRTYVIFRAAVLAHNELFNEILLTEVQENNAQLLNLQDFFANRFNIFQAQLAELSESSRVLSGVADQVDRLPGKIRELILGNISQISIDYAGRIQNFVDEYLGTPEHPVPFGGRRDEMAELHNWLNETTAPPYLLIVSEAGRGKSALLVHWAKHVIESNQAEVIFIPVSIRFNTAHSSVTFKALAARLAQAYGEDIKHGELSMDQWRDTCSTYLKRQPPLGKTIVIILDGLDEAADWQPSADLFPLAVPPGIRVLASARPLPNDVNEQGWLRRLGWNRADLAGFISLPLLTKEDIMDVVRTSESPIRDLATDAIFLEDLYRVTEGDPLLIRLYLNKLLEKNSPVFRGSPVNFANIHPGLEGYFQQWWEEQVVIWAKASPLKEKLVRDVLSIMACSFGPLKSEDIINIIEVADVDTWALDDSMASLQRLVFGDGRNFGYVFTHPRLNEFFYNKLTLQERTSWEARFIQWGQRTLVSLNSKTILPQSVPSYLLHNYLSHLQRGAELNRYMAELLKVGWKEAWYLYEGSYSGYLHDIERIWHWCEKENYQALITGRVPPYIDIEIRCALYEASANSLSTNIPEDLLVALVENELWTPIQALEYAQRVPAKESGNKRAKALRAIAPFLTGDLVRQALQVARDIVECDEKALTLTKLASSLPKSDQSLVMHDAVDNARKYNQTDWYWTTLYVAKHLPNPEKKALLEEAIERSRKIENRSNRISAFSALIPHLPRKRRDEILSTTLDTIRSIKDKRQRAFLYSELLPNLKKKERELLARELFDVLAIINDRQTIENIMRQLARFISITSSEEDEKSREESPKAYENLKMVLTFPSVIVRLAELGQRETALLLAKKLEYTFEKVEALLDLVPYLNQRRRIEILREVKGIIESQEEDFRHDMRPKLAGRLAQSGLYAEALQLARYEDSENLDSQAIKEIIPYLSESQLLSVYGLITDYLLRPDAPQNNRFDNLWIEPLVLIASRLPQQSRPAPLKAALKISQEIDDAGMRAEVLAQMVPNLDKSLVPDLITAIRCLNAKAFFNPNTWPRCDALAFVAPYLTEETTKIALDMVKALPSKWEQSKGMIALLSGMPESERPALIQSALAAAESEESLPNRFQALVEVGQYLADSQKDEVIQEALAVLRKVKPRRNYRRSDLDHIRFSLLIEAAPGLPASVIKDVLIKMRSRRYHTTKLETYMFRTTRRNDEWFYYLRRLISKLPYSMLSEALATANSINSHRDYLLVGVAAREAEIGNPERAIGIANSITADLYKVQALTMIIPFLTGNIQARMIDETKTIAMSIKERQGRDRVLADLAPYLPASTLKEVFLDVFHGSSYSSLSSGYTISRVTPSLVPLPRPELYSLWKEAMRDLARETRSTLLIYLHRLQPITVVLGGEKAINGAYLAIQEAAALWP